jgi:hypothetical protein
MDTESAAEVVGNVFMTLALLSFFILLALEKKRPHTRFDPSISRESILTNLSAFFLTTFS